MKTVQILCAENITLLHKPGAWAIEQAENLNYCHVAILIDDFVYEAVWPRSRKIRLKDWLTKFKIIKIYELEFDEHSYQNFLVEIFLQLGRPYSLTQIVLIWLSNCLGILENYINKTIWNGNKALICSEFVARPITRATDCTFAHSFDTVDLFELESVLKSISKKVIICE